MAGTKAALKILEDKSTLLQIQHSDEGTLHASTGSLISFFAIQPVHDLENAAKTLFRVTAQPGVQVIRNIFTALPKNAQGYMKNETSYSAISLLVRINYKFNIKSDQILPVILHHVRKEFLKRRSMTHTILLGMGFEIKLVEGKNIIDLHIQGRKIKEGITVFPSKNGLNSKLIEGFLKLDRVPSRFFQDFIAPDLPVIHRIGSRVDDPTKVVGFPNITNGKILLCGTDNLEILNLLQTLTNSFSLNTEGAFIIDTHNEFNGLVRYYQENPSALQGKNLQVFQLGRNMFINLCDVVIPLSKGGKKLDMKTIGAWKAYIISQIILGSLATSNYLTSRFAIPLESQIQKRAKIGSGSFTLEDVKAFSVDTPEKEEGNEQENPIDGIFADMMAVEQITGILDHFKAFPEVNYPAFTGHFSNTLARTGTVTVFQFGSQSPLIKRAVVAFLLQFLSNTVNNDLVIFPHSDEYLGQKTSYSNKTQEAIPTSLIDSINCLARNNVLILGSQSLSGLSKKLPSFDEIKNQVYLHLANSEDRDLIITKHQLPGGKNKWDSHQRIGIVEGEGLLFRLDTPSNIAYHFKLDKNDGIPVDLNPISTSEAKRRGSTTLGLTPKKYQILMKILKVLYHGPYRTTDAVKIIESETEGNLILGQFGSLDLYRESTELGVSYWVMTSKGRDFYKDQLELLRGLTTAPSSHEIIEVAKSLKNLEEFNESSDSDDERKKTNENVKNLIASLLNLIYQISDAPPWERVADYSELKSINGLEYPDFHLLFDSAYSLATKLLLDYKNLKDNLPDDVLKQREISSALGNSGNTASLDNFLPTDSLLSLKTISKDLELEKYPEISIISIFFELHRQSGKNLVVEIKKGLENEDVS